MKYDVVALGDCTIDAYTHLHDANIQCQLKGEECLLCMDFATKIPLEEPVQFVSAGNCNNVAVASSKLGLKSALHSVVGDDENGHFILKSLKDAGVDVGLMQIDPTNRTNFHIILSFKGERTILIFHEPFEYNLINYDAKWIYFSSVSEPQVKKLQDHLIKTLAQSTTKLAFNPATFQIKQGLDFLKPIIFRTDMLFMNKEEYQRVLSAEEDPNPVSLMKKMKEFSQGILVLTDGPKGSYAMSGGNETNAWFLGIPDTPIVDRTGTGDAFGSAFLTATILGKDIPEALRWGTIEASYKIGQKGPQGGLMTANEMEEKLKFHADLIPQEAK